jgi:hypothetical protein
MDDVNSNINHTSCTIQKADTEQAGEGYKPSKVYIVQNFARSVPLNKKAQTPQLRSSDLSSISFSDSLRGFARKIVKKNNSFSQSNPKGGLRELIKINRGKLCFGKSSTTP